MHDVRESGAASAHVRAKLQRHERLVVVGRDALGGAGELATTGVGDHGVGASTVGGVEECR